MDDDAKQLLAQGLSMGIQALLIYFQQRGLTREDILNQFDIEYAKFRNNKPETLPDA